MVVRFIEKNMTKYNFRGVNKVYIYHRVRTRRGHDGQVDTKNVN